MQSDVPIVQWIKQRVIRDSASRHASQEKQRGDVRWISSHVWAGAVWLNRADTGVGSPSRAHNTSPLSPSPSPSLLGCYRDQRRPLASARSLFKFPGNEDGGHKEEIPGITEHIKVLSFLSILYIRKVHWIRFSTRALHSLCMLLPPLHKTSQHGMSEIKHEHA